MRPKRTGTSSGTRVRFVRSRIAIGSSRSAGGTQPAWLDRGVTSRRFAPARRPASGPSSDTVNDATLAGVRLAGAFRTAFGTAFRTGAAFFTTAVFLATGAFVTARD